MNNKLMNRQEVADYLGRSVVTIDRWRKLHGLPCSMVGLSRLFIKADVDTWLEGKRKPVKVSAPATKESSAGARP